MLHSNTTTIIEFCAGYCGIGLGLGRAIRNLRTIAYCEREAFAVANLAAKVEAGKLDAAPIYTDLLTFPYGRFNGLVDIAAAGIPCQPHSLAGKRKGGSDERFLFGDWLDGLELMQPRYILIENVEGLLSSRMPDGTLCIGWTSERLESMGYTVEAGIFSAEEVGAPHRRKRVFILAKRLGDTEHDGQFAAEARGSIGAEQGEGRVPELTRRRCEPSDELAHHKRERRQEQYWQKSEQSEQHTTRNLGIDVWPSRPGQPQYEWEPPRVVENTINVREHRRPDVGNRSAGEQQDCETTVPGGTSEDRRTDDRAFKSPLDGNADGLACRMDYAELCRSCDNRTDELRLLGNGVVPATAERAWRILYQRIKD